MTNKFIKFQEYLKRLNSICLRALCAFAIFDKIEELKTPNIVGKKEALKNVEAMNSFNNYFLMTTHALKFYFLIELARLLDNAKQSLHIEKLINFASSNKKYLNVDEFKANNQNRPFLKDLTDRYKGIEEQDIKKINELLISTKSIRKKIQDYRDQYLAHEDLNKSDIKINRDEIIEIFALVKTILNIFSYKTDFSVTSFKLAEKDCKKDIERILILLKNSL